MDKSIVIQAIYYTSEHNTHPSFTFHRLKQFSTLPICHFFPHPPLTQAYYGGVMYCAPPANPTQLKRLFDRALPAVYPPTGAPVTTTTSPVKPLTLHPSTTQGISVATRSRFRFSVGLNYLLK